MKGISVLKKGSYRRTVNPNSKMKNTYTLIPIGIPEGSFRFVCCVCQDSYFSPKGCIEGIWEGRGIYFGEDFYILVDPVEAIEEHKDCLEMLNLNPLGYLDNETTHEKR